MPPYLRKAGGGPAPPEMLVVLNLDGRVEGMTGS